VIKSWAQSEKGIVKFMDNIQYVVDNTGKPVSAIVPIDLWNNLEQAKDILEHVYLSGLIDSRKHDTISCTLDDMLKMEGLTRHGLES
jgi:hypothetical protein